MRGLEGSDLGFRRGGIGNVTLFSLQCHSKLEASCTAARGRCHSSDFEQARVREISLGGFDMAQISLHADLLAEEYGSTIQEVWKQSIFQSQTPFHSPVWRFQTDDNLQQSKPP